VNYELPVASLLLDTADCLLLTADCLLLTADCLLRLRGFELVGLLARTADYHKMSPPTGKEKTSNFKN
jgi:hypothetical protein